MRAGTRNGIGNKSFVQVCFIQKWFNFGSLFFTSPVWCLHCLTIMNFLTLVYAALKVLTATPSESTISKVIPPHESTWTYDGKGNGINDWYQLYPKCKGQFQSPINIDTRLVDYNSSMKIDFIGFQKLYQAFIENNGHTVQLGVEESTKPVLTGSAVDNKIYVFAQLHFHWGTDSLLGSEHSINSTFYPLEGHLAFYRKEYESFDKALNYSDGLVVVSIFFKHADEENHALDRLIKGIQKIPRYRDKSLIPGFFNFSDILPSSLNNFYKYSGSLTTPPCLEIVTWLIIAEPVNISEGQTEIFRHERANMISSKTGEYAYLNHNYREQSPLNHRRVTASFMVNSNTDQNEYIA